MDFPLAYHITFGTYGARLHGDSRLTVDRRRNEYGESFIGRNDRWAQDEAARKRFDLVSLHIDQRLFVESAIPAICARGGWEYRIAACQHDHVHILLSTDREGKSVRKWLKRWLGEVLAEKFTSPIGCSWWAEGGSVKWIWKNEYFHRAFEYIERQRATPISSAGQNE